jgi:hypothetical protein
MDEASKSAWCRERGVYPQELEQWRKAPTQALADPEPSARISHREPRPADAASRSWSDRELQE